MNESTSGHIGRRRLLVAAAAAGAGAVAVGTGVYAARGMENETPTDGETSPLSSQLPPGEWKLDPDLSDEFNGTALDLDK